MINLDHSLKKPVAETVRLAARVLETQGWRQGAFSEDWDRKRGAMCTVGAIRFAATGDPLQLHDFHSELPLAAFCEWLLDNEEVNIDYGSFAVAVVGWNDAPSRTVGEVLTALRAFADEVDPPQ